MKRRILVLGAGKAARQLAAREGTDVEIVGYMPAPGQGECVFPRKLRDTERSLLDLVREYGIHEVVIALDDQRKARPGPHLAVDAETLEGALYRRLDPSRIQASPLAVRNLGDRPADAVVTVTGVPVAPEPAGAPVTRSSAPTTTCRAGGWSRRSSGRASACWSWSQSGPSASGRRA